MSNLKPTDDFFKQFESLDTAFANAAKAGDQLGKTMRRAIWKAVVCYIVLGLIGVLGTALTVGVAGGVILGLLKLFGVI